MVWRFLNSGENTGKFNMDLDIKLASEYNESEVIFRVYKWKPYCISLGANQSLQEINISKAESDNIDIVKRPTGGRAILHSQEITYSVIYPIDYNTSAHNLYNEINLALKKGLTLYDSILNDIRLENKQPDFKQFYKQDKSAICFAVSARSEINFNNKKLVGSAQRKFGRVILQHGSILCGDYHLNIVNYLNMDEKNKLQIKNELMHSTIDLKSILGKEINYTNLIESLKKGFKDHFQIEFKMMN